MGKPIGFAAKTVNNFGLPNSAIPRVHTLQLVAPSKIISEVKTKLEKAGIRVGPGVDLRLR
jgi:hypothetical protein